MNQEDRMILATSDHITLHKRVAELTAINEKLANKLEAALGVNRYIRERSAARAVVLADWYDKLLEMGWDLKDDLKGLGVARPDVYDDMDAAEIQARLNELEESE